MQNAFVGSNRYSARGSVKSPTLSCSSFCACETDLPRCSNNMVRVSHSVSKAVELLLIHPTSLFLDGQFLEKTVLRPQIVW